MDKRKLLSVSQVVDAITSMSVLFHVQVTVSTRTKAESVIHERMFWVTLQRRHNQDLRIILEPTQASETRELKVDKAVVHVGHKELKSKGAYLCVIFRLAYHYSNAEFSFNHLSVQFILSESLSCIVLTTRSLTIEFDRYFLPDNCECRPI